MVAAAILVATFGLTSNWQSAIGSWRPSRLAAGPWRHFSSRLHRYSMSRSTVTAFVGAVLLLRFDTQALTRSAMTSLLASAIRLALPLLFYSVVKDRTCKLFTSRGTATCARSFDSCPGISRPSCRPTRPQSGLASISHPVTRKTKGRACRGPRPQLLGGWLLMRPFRLNTSRMTQG